MNVSQRITISLPADLLNQVRQASDGNVSQFITNILREHLEQERRRKLREALIAAAIANAEEDLATAEAFRYAEDEAVALYIPPHLADEPEGHSEPILAEQSH